MTKKAEKLAEQQAAKAKLLSILQNGSTVYTVIRQTSRQSVMRHISLLTVVDGDLIDITYLAAQIIDLKLPDNGWIKVGGAGVDIGYHLTSGLCCALGYTLNHKKPDQPGRWA